MPAREPKIVTIGGGTGSFTVLSGLKFLARISAIISMVDDGGSTGVLRDEMGVLPSGDVRQAIIALLEDDELSNQLRDYFNYRPTKGPFKGHPAGNMILATLESFTGSNAEAIDVFSRLLRIRGHVIPITDKNVRLNLRLPSGKVVRGEKVIGEECANQAFFQLGLRPDLFVDPAAVLADEARIAIEEADMIVICPGKLYSSVGPNLLFEGITTALSKSRAKKVYICNLMTQLGQTDNYRVTDFPDALEQLAGEQIFDYVLANTTQPDETLLRRYAAEGEALVLYNSEDFADKHYEVIGKPLFSDTMYVPQAGDTLQRTLIRHDSDRLARALMEIYYR